MAFLQEHFRHGPSFERVRWALGRSHRFAPRQQKSATEHLYFSVRSAVAMGGRQVLQYGFADDRGNVVLSVFGESGMPAYDHESAPPEDLAAEPLTAANLAMLVREVCRGASLVAFHKVLHGGLLPPGAAQGAASLDCAWRRYLRLARRRGCFSRSEPVTLDDALETIGVGAVGQPDAALRALGVRELWTWMDSVE